MMGLIRRGDPQTKFDGVWACAQKTCYRVHLCQIRSQESECSGFAAHHFAGQRIIDFDFHAQKSRAVGLALRVRPQ